MRRTRGFTLIEILVALSLAGLLVAGAFQIHAMFNSQARRQQQLNDIQQSLRASMQVIERSLRGSGAGLSNGKALLAPGCAGPRTFYRLQFYNSNVWPPPVTTGFDTTPGLGSDTDPDILRIISAADAGVNLVTADNGSIATVTGSSSYAVGDVMVLMNTAASTTTTATGCLRQVTAATAIPGTPSGPASVLTSTLTHGAGGSLCANTDPTCVLGITYPTPVRRFRNQTFFRIQPPVGSEGPKLVLGVAPIGDPAAAQTWSVVADDIEDMQVALLMADGSVCNDRDDPSLPACDPSLANAVRVTLTARTPSSVPGMPRTYTGGYEDGTTALASDGRLRRSLTTEIILRN